jgi:hypothetical protein
MRSLKLPQFFVCVQTKIGTSATSANHIVREVKNTIDFFLKCGILQLFANSGFPQQQAKESFSFGRWVAADPSAALYQSAPRSIGPKIQVEPALNKPGLQPATANYFWRNAR